MSVYAVWLYKPFTKLWQKVIYNVTLRLYEWIRQERGMYDEWPAGGTLTKSGSIWDEFVLHIKSSSEALLNT